MCGHDHVLQYIEHMTNSDAPDYLISGAGSKMRPGMDQDSQVKSCQMFVFVLFFPLYIYMDMYTPVY